MVLSEKSPEDKQKAKNGIMAIGVLVACFALGPLVMAEFTGVDVDTLCVEDKIGENEGEKCLDDEGTKGEIKSGLKDILGFYMPLAVFILGVITFAVVGFKY